MFNGWVSQCYDSNGPFWLLLSSFNPIENEYLKQGKQIYICEFCKNPYSLSKCYKSVYFTEMKNPNFEKRKQTQFWWNIIFWKKIWISFPQIIFFWHKYFLRMLNKKGMKNDFIWEQINVISVKENRNLGFSGNRGVKLLKTHPL